jgi:hypothetical protein
MAIGCDIHLDSSNIDLEGFKVEDICAYDADSKLSLTEDPTNVPVAIGIRHTRGTHDINIKNCNIDMVFRGDNIINKNIPAFDIVRENIKI